MKDVLRLYRGRPWRTRAFLTGRVLLSDLESIERHVPQEGAVLDLGCGHGLFANLMALRSGQRRVIGIDLSAEKIEEARSATGGPANVEFVCGDILDMPLPACDAVTIVDVLYLLPREDQRRILEACHRLLRPGGVLVWKAQERRPAWKFAWTYLQEVISIRLGLTKGKRGKLCFLSRQDAQDLLVSSGFMVKIIEMPTRLPYTDILYLGKKVGTIVSTKKDKLLDFQGHLTQREFPD